MTYTYTVNATNRPWSFAITPEDQSRLDALQLGSRTAALAPALNTATPEAIASAIHTRLLNSPVTQSKKVRTSASLPDTITNRVAQMSEATGISTETMVSLAIQAALSRRTQHETTHQLPSVQEEPHH